MSLYDPSQIVGITLYAKQNIPVYRGNQLPNGTPFATVNAGQPVGVVYSYVMEGSDLFWMFYDHSNGAYYSKHGNYSYDVSAIQQQGALSVEEEVAQQAAQDEANNSWLPDLGFDLPDTKTMLFWGAGLVLGIVAIKKLL